MWFEVGLVKSVKRQQAPQPPSSIRLLTAAVSAPPYPLRRNSGGVYTGAIRATRSPDSPAAAMDTGAGSTQRKYLFPSTPDVTASLPASTDMAASGVASI